MGINVQTSYVWTHRHISQWIQIYNIGIHSFLRQTPIRHLEQKTLKNAFSFFILSSAMGPSINHVDRFWDFYPLPGPVSLRGHFY